MSMTPVEPEETLPTVPLRPEVVALPRYVPGRSFPRARKLSSNEAPHAPAERVRGEAAATLEEANRYPDLTCAPLREALATHHGLTPEQVVVGAGSSGVLLAALMTMGASGAEVVFPWRSFESYPIAVPAAHATPVPVPLDDSWGLDLDAMVAAVTERTVALVLCTPNNPTGPALTREQVAGVLRRVPEHVLVLVDEAYMEFTEDPEGRTAVPLLEWHPNLMVLRTFSKAYGLAGLRVGYGLAHPRLVGAVQAVSVPFAVSSPAQAAALAALADDAGMRATVAEVVAERERVREALRGMGFEVPASGANFVFLPGLGADFVEACLAAGLVVRPFPEGVRVTISTPEDDDRFLEVARAF